jgi:hypothetical protein
MSDEMETIKGTIVFSTLGTGADMTVETDDGEIVTVPIHTRDFDKAIPGRKVVWKHERGNMPTLKITS